MPDYCIIDFETRSLANLPEVDTVNYAKDKSTGIISISFAFLSEYEKTGKIYSYTSFREGDMEKAAEILSKFKGIVVAHNYFFEQMIFKYVWNSPKLKHFTEAENYVCTLALSLRFGLPGKLEDAAIAAGLSQLKDAEAGRKLIMKFSVPKKGKLLEPNKQDIEDFIKYGEQDVRAEIELFQKLKGFDGFELKSFRLDQKINGRGLHLDVKNIKKLEKRYNELFANANQRALDLAGTEESGTPTIKSSSGFVRWLNEKGYKVDNAQKPTLDKLAESLGNSKKDQLIKEVLQIRQMLSLTAPSKLSNMLAKNSDGFAYKLLQYYGAHTGRWAGRSFQPHNLIRDAIEEKDFDRVLKSVIDGSMNDFDAISTIGKLLRSLILPHKGNIFVLGDFTAIEPRVGFWIAGCRLGIDQFKNFDLGKGEEPYVIFANLSRLPSSIPAKIQRQVGKVGVLSLQYGIGEDLYSDKLVPYIGRKDKSLGLRVKLIYRKTYHEVPKMWKLLEDSFIKAVMTKKEISIRDGLLKIKPIKSGLKVTLPSGRAIYFRNAGVSKGKFFYYHPRYKKVHLWGGSMFEIITQAISRDVMVEAMAEIDSYKHLEIALTVHDEIIAESPLKHKKESLEFFRNAMNKAPSWAPGLPIKASYGTAKRYGKT